MELAYRQDWPEAAERLGRWWQGEFLGRPMMQVTAPRVGVEPRRVPQAPNLWEHWTNPQYVVPRYEESMRRTAFFGEACPQTYINMGPVSAAGYLGCTPRVMPTTVWQEPCVENWATYAPQIHRESPWWRHTYELALSLGEAAAGKWFVCEIGLADAGDTLSYLRGAERLLVDLMERPRDEMMRVRDRLVELLWEVHAEFTQVLSRWMEGTSSWLGVWSPKQTVTLQCDVSCMVSPAMFDEFFAPAVAAQCLQADHVIYHLDGAGALQHVDTLLALPRLHAIQWVPGAGEEGPAHPKWRPLLRRIIKAGKRVHVSVAPQEVQDLLADLPADGLAIATGCRSEEEARELLRRARQWSHA